MPSFRTRSVRSALLLCGVATLSACSSATWSRVPPRMDLVAYGRVALAPFGSSRDDSAAALLATQRFAESVLDAQRLELLELTPSDTGWRAAADSAGAPAVFLGDLVLTTERPSGTIGLSGVHVRSAVTAELRVRLVSTATGGTLWRSSAQRRSTLGHVAVTRGGLPTMSVRDREDAYGELVGELVADVTRDLRESWVKQ